MKRLLKCMIVALLVSSVGIAWGGAAQPRKPAAGDKCPVCGMFVAKFPDFAAQVHFKDGSVYYFDGSKDLFKYYLNSERYTPGKKKADIRTIYVTNYYDLFLIDGTTAWYVNGSNVFGSMGRELIAFARESEAREFKKDHKGKSLLRFKDITPAIIKGLD
jgi:copper chaperone NosL